MPRVKERFEDNIVELCSCGLPVMQISTMDYNLKNYVYWQQQNAKGRSADARYGYMPKDVKEG